MLTSKEVVVRRLRKSAGIGFAALAFLALALSAQAQQNLVTNGSFEDTTNGPGQLGYNTNEVGWTTTGYNFVFAYGTGDTTGSNGQYGNVSFWARATARTTGSQPAALTAAIFSVLMAPSKSSRSRKQLTA